MRFTKLVPLSKLNRMSHYVQNKRGLIYKSSNDKLDDSDTEVVIE